MIFEAGPDGLPSFQGGPTEDGGFCFYDGAHAVRLSHEDCVRLAALLLQHIFKTITEPCKNKSITPNITKPAGSPANRPI